MNYTIKKGDTLSELARRNNTTITELLKLNPSIKNPDRILAGATLQLPSAQASPSAPVSPIPKASSSPLDGLVKPETVPLSGTSPVVSPVNQDRFRSSQGMEATPELAALQALGLGGLIYGAGAAIPSLARLAPTTARAGVTGNAVRGAVHHAGAAPSASNVAPVFPNNPGAAQALVQAALARQPLARGGSLGPASPPVGNGQTLTSGSRMPWMGQGTQAPTDRLSLASLLGML